MGRAFLSPGERRILAELDRHPLPDGTRGDGLETEADVVRRLMETFDARLVDVVEPPRARSPQLALPEPARPRAYRDDTW